MGYYCDTVSFNYRGGFEPLTSVVVTIVVLDDGSSNVNLGDSVHNFSRMETAHYLEHLSHTIKGRG